MYLGTCQTLIVDSFAKLILHMEIKKCQVQFIMKNTFDR